MLEILKSKDVQYEVLFLDAEDTVLVKRYKETRRSHPLAQGERVDKGIMRERQKMEFLKKEADYIIDTSRLLTRELKTELEKIFVQDEEFNSMYVTILSFGFKYGIPADSDIVMDVRFLPNPYYVEELRPKTGNDVEIQQYVMKYDEAKIFLNKLEDMVTFLIPHNISNGCICHNPTSIPCRRCGKHQIQHDRIAQGSNQKPWTEFSPACSGFCNNHSHNRIVKCIKHPRCHENNSHCHRAYSENILIIIQNIARRKHIYHIFSDSPQAECRFFFC